MAKRGTNKFRSQEHEKYVAFLYEGKVSPSSGAAPADAGDVRVWATNELIECKVKGEPGKPARSTLVKQMEKIADEAWAEARDPVLCLRFFMPDSPLADKKGWVDLSVRVAGDDAHRSYLVREERGQTCPADGRRPPLPLN